jgi:hypothetical protein
MPTYEDSNVIRLNTPENMQLYRDMYGLKVCGFCEHQYNPKKYFDGVMYKDDKPICHRCLYPYKYSH